MVQVENMLIEILNGPISSKHTLSVISSKHTLCVIFVEVYPLGLVAPCLVAVVAQARIDVDSSEPWSSSSLRHRLLTSDL